MIFIFKNINIGQSPDVVKQYDNILWHSKANAKTCKAWNKLYSWHQGNQNLAYDTMERY